MNYTSLIYQRIEFLKETITNDKDLLKLKVGRLNFELRELQEFFNLNGYYDQDIIDDAMITYYLDLKEDVVDNGNEDMLKEFGLYDFESLPTFPEFLKYMNSNSKCKFCKNCDCRLDDNNNLSTHRIKNNKVNEVDFEILETTNLHSGYCNLCILTPSFKLRINDLEERIFNDSSIEITEPTRTNDSSYIFDLFEDDEKIIKYYKKLYIILDESLKVMKCEFCKKTYRVKRKKYIDHHFLMDNLQCLFLLEEDIIIDRLELYKECCNKLKKYICKYDWTPDGYETDTQEEYWL